VLAADSAAAGIEMQPRFVVVDTTVPGALAQATRARRADRPRFVLALIGPDERDGEALAAGASLTLRRPWLTRDVVLVLERMRTESERWTAAREMLDRDRTAVSVPVIESVLGALQHELRNPLAAALSNTECLREALPPEAPEPRAMADEIQASLRRVTSVLDTVSKLIDGRPLEHERIALIDAVKAAARRTSSRAELRILGEASVLGWGNRELLTGVLSTLIEDAIAAHRGGEAPALAVRTYATRTEARITLRDSVSEPERAPGGFEPVIKLGGDDGTGLSLPLVRHAIARMRGTIELARDERGRVFRIRLKRA
jgi:signal transduction histidine kinase